jgi:hypothetical protein
MIIHDDESDYRASAPKYDAENGAAWYFVKSHGTLVAKTPYARSWDETGYLSAAVPSTATFKWVFIVPHQAAVVSDLLLMQFAGFITAVVTPSLSMGVGHAFGVAAGAITDEGADPTLDEDEFAVSTAATTSATTHNMWLMGIEVVHP